MITDYLTFMDSHGCEKYFVCTSDKTIVLQITYLVCASLSLTIMKTSKSLSYQEHPYTTLLYFIEMGACVEIKFMNRWPGFRLTITQARLETQQCI